MNKPILAVGTLFALVGVWPLVHPSGEIVVDLVFGWMGFLWRVAPRSTVRWDGVAFFILSHYFLRWFFQQSPEASSVSRRQWKWRGTLAVSALVVVAFWAGISMIGVVHQAAWLANSDEPMFDTRLDSRGTTSSSNQLKFIGMGAHSYWEVWPGGRSDVAEHSWATFILPYMNYASDIDLTRPWDDPQNIDRFRSVLPEFINGEFRTAPVVDGRGLGLSHFAGNDHVLGERSGYGLNEGRGGSSNTLFVGEVNRQFIAWGDPSNTRDPNRGINSHPHGFGGPPHRRGALFLFVDGSVKPVDERIDPRVLRALSGADESASLP